VLRRTLIAALAATALAAPGCREDDPELPAACRDGTRAISAALASAPGPVRIDGTRLSRCLTDEADAADLNTVGSAFTTVAGTLADTAAHHRGGAAEVRLGYLIGAARRGAAGTAGLHSELVRRLEQEADVLGRPSAAFRRGERAGRADG
jgi:hypothetical protein